jgi:hypothetical protein
MKHILTAAFVSAILWPFAATAADYYAAPDGTKTGDGSKEKPWDFPTAMAHPNAGKGEAIPKAPADIVKPGDTIWVKGGTYKFSAARHFLSCRLKGSAEAPITVRPLPGERVTIDLDGQAFYVGGVKKDDKGVEVADLEQGHDVLFRDFEITATGIPRSTDKPGSWTILNSFVDVRAPGTKFINMVVHDLSQGFSFWSPSSRAEMYGCLSYHNGWNAPDRGHGHGLYTQNTDTGDNVPKVIAENFLFEGFNEGIQAYGSAHAVVQNYVFQGNVVWDNGILAGNLASGIVLAGGGKSKKNIVLEDNDFYISTSAQGQNSLGWGWDDVNDDIVIKNNRFIGGYSALEVYRWNKIAFTGNTLYAQDKSSMLGLYLSQKQSTSEYAWDKNTYYGKGSVKLMKTGPDGKGNYPVSSATDGTWDAWKTASKLDANSSYSASAPTGVWTFVRANKYEKGRANVVIYNWDKKDSVAVDLAKSGLAEGDKYEVRDVQDFYGKPAATGTYKAGETAAIPMTGLTKAQVVGAKTPAHTAPLFGAFVVMPVRAAAK